jgi:hypothetical protein
MCLSGGYRQAEQPCCQRDFPCKRTLLPMVVARGVQQRREQSVGSADLGPSLCVPEDSQNVWVAWVVRMALWCARGVGVVCVVVVIVVVVVAAAVVVVVVVVVSNPLTFLVSVCLLLLMSGGTTRKSSQKQK